MSTLPVYSTLFSTLYDEQDPIGSLGRGSHYSVLRSVEWQDVELSPLAMPQVHDFAIIWDEDHDTRVLEAIEMIYMEGLLAPVQFIGERKGSLTVIVAAKFYFSGLVNIEEYTAKIHNIAQSLDDPWPGEVGYFDRTPWTPEIGHHQCEPEGIIMADTDRVITYLKNIDSLWSLGTKEYAFNNPIYI